MHDLDRTLLELPESHLEEAPPFDPELELELESETGLDEAEEMELASEALGLQDDTEMEYFLGKLISSVTRKAGRALRSPVGGALVGILKNAARKALPMAGTAVGSMVGGPFGTALGAKLGSQAGSLLGLELEGLSPQDQEFETARQFVKFAGAAAQNALNSAMGGGSPVDAAAKAVATAAKSYAPGLLQKAGAYASASGLQSGRWFRRGNTIVIVGV